MTAPVLLDLSHTSHTRARTGIQRVARALRSALNDRAMPITHDPYLGAWRPLERWEEANLTATAPAKARGARWPLAAKLAGRLGRMKGGRGISSSLGSVSVSGLLVPEVFSAAVA